MQDNSKKGIFLAAAGVIVLSPDSLLVRLIEVPFFTLMFWRGIFMFLILNAFLKIQHKANFLSHWKKVSKQTIVMSIIFAVSTYAFVASLHYTSVAHTLLIVGSSPVITALFAVFILKEMPVVKVWLAMFVILAALFFVVQQPSQVSSIKGDLLALISAIILGYVFVYVRQHDAIDQIQALSLTGLWVALIALFFNPILEVTIGNALALFFLALIVGAAFSMITLSARYIAAPITSMFMPLETVLGVFLVWLIIGEEPTLSTILGGVVVITALVYISYYELKTKNVT